MKPSPVLTGLRTYPFVRLTEAKRRLVERGVRVIDFGVGEPREDTPPFIREALAAAVTARSTYPLAEGLPELRAAVADWIERRFGPRLDPDTEILPTLGSKEAIFHLAQVVGGDLVAVTAPGYPVAERGAAFAGKGVVELPLAAERGFVADLDAVDPATWARTAILWLNYPNNPTAATAPLELYERAAAIAREHDVVVASDEAYSEIYFGAEPPASALQVADRRNVIALNTLSKRSSMPGYRSGFVAGDAEVIAALKRYRPNVGVAPPEFIQHAAAAAWSDEAHVEDVRALYRAKREVLLDVLEAGGLRHAGGDATFFLWLDAGERADALAAELLEHGVVLAPGSFFGPAGEGFLRLALVPTLAECQRAAELLAVDLARSDPARPSRWRAGRR
jgi:succinyldiaminopimelate transaminase